MKKITKRIMALMLSLVMMLGCIPSFINEASADGTKTVEQIIQTATDFPTTEQKGWKSEKGSVCYFDGTSLSFVADGAGMGVPKGKTCTFEDNKYLYNEFQSVEFNMKNNRLISIVVTNGPDKVVGTYHSSYIKNIELIGEGSFPDANNKGTYIYKAPDDENYTVKSTTWYKDEECTTPLGDDELNSDTFYYAKVVVEPNTNYEFETENPNPLNPVISSYDGMPEKELELTKNSLTVLVRKVPSRTSEFTHITVNDKQDLAAIQNHIKQADQNDYIKLDPQCGDSITFGAGSLNGISDKIGEYFTMMRIKNTEQTPSNNIESETKTNSITKINYNGSSYNVNNTHIEQLLGMTIYTEEEEYTKLLAYLREHKLLAQASKGYISFFDDNPRDESDFCIYQYYDFGVPGTLTFSGLTQDNAVKNITASGNLGTDGTVESATFEIGTLEDGTYTKITDLEETKLEKDKQYQIKFYIENEKYDINNLTINGQNVSITMGSNYPVETGCVYKTSNLTQKMYITYIFTPQSSSSGGSKKYKAIDDKKTTEKITGTGKKGSKRTIIPEPNRKVLSVIVTDKDGNKYEVTNEGDGTYSFIQPGTNVDVEVKYKNRLIELTIGSLDASVDDVHHNLDVVPKVVNDRTMLPIRFVAENLGAKVDWDEKDPDTVIIARGDTKIVITLGSDKAYVNGEEYILDSVAFAENDRTYLPVRFVSEKLNAIVEWNEAHPMDVKIYERQ